MPDSTNVAVLVWSNERDFIPNLDPQLSMFPQMKGLVALHQTSIVRGAQNLVVTNRQVFSDCRSESERYAVVVPSHKTQQLEWLRHHVFSGTAFARIA